MLSFKALKPISLSVFSKRFLNLHEYQCKRILSDNSLNVQKFGVASDKTSALKIAKDLGSEEFVIKAQILAGGRGKGIFNNGFQGGVHLTKDPNKVADLVFQMLGHRLVTKQTPPEGVLVTVCEARDIEKETYLAILLDPGVGQPVIVGSPIGGMDIEDVAHKSPEKILKLPVDILTGPTKDQCLKMARFLEFPYLAAEQIMKLYELLIKVDATQVEINPFGVASNNTVLCFDSKIAFDDNASFRQKEIFDMEDKSETPPAEVKATEAGLAYIQMDGNIGCIVNGAGLAMATLDIVQLYNGKPSNFLDLGGGADVERVKTALQILAEDTRVKAIFVNIFGGIVDCRLISKGFQMAQESFNPNVPIVMRLQGNHFEEAKKMLDDIKGCSITLIDDFETAAKAAASAIK